MQMHFYEYFALIFFKACIDYLKKHIPYTIPRCSKWWPFVFTLPYEMVESLKTMVNIENNH